MAIRRIIARRMATSGHGHEHISRLQWQDDSNGKVDDSLRSEMVGFIESNGPTAVYVRDGFGNVVNVGVRSNQYGKWVQTFADGKWTDNLLALPLF